MALVVLSLPSGSTAQPYAVVSGDPGVLSVVDLHSRQRVATVGVPADYFTVLVSPDARHVLIEGYLNGEPRGWWWRLDTGSMRAYTFVGLLRSARFSPDSQRLYQHDHHQSSLRVTSTLDGSTLANASFEELTSLEVAPDGRRLFVSQRSLNRVLEIDAATMTVARTLESPSPTSMQFPGDGPTLYVAGGMGWQLFDTTTGAPAGRLRCGDGYLSRDGTMAYGIDYRFDYTVWRDVVSVQAVNTATCEVRRREIPGIILPAQIQIDDAAGVGYLVGRGSPSLSVIDLATLESVATIPVGGWSAEDLTISGPATAPCTYSVSPASIEDAGAGGILRVATQEGCLWAAQPLDTRLELDFRVARAVEPDVPPWPDGYWLPVQLSLGPGSVRYLVRRVPPSVPVTSTVDVAGHQVSVTHAGGCSYLLEGSALVVTATPRIGTVTVHRPEPCPAPAATSGVPWFEVREVLSANSRAYVSYLILPNDGPVPRIGTVDIGGQRLIVTQAGAGGQATDQDADGLPDDWERRVGLDPEASSGHNGADGDPDNDGVPNLQELAEGTHPRGTAVRFLAEGANTPIFRQAIALLNPGETSATVNLRFLRPDGPPLSHVLAIPSRTRRTVETHSIAGLEQAEFSTVVESDALVVVDRTMSWDVASGYGAHAETAVAAPASTWYLAEGATHSGFDLFYLLQNPSSVQAEVAVRYLRPSGHPLEKTYALAPNSRTTIWVDHEIFGNAGAALADSDVSAVMKTTDGTAIIVERAMYQSSQGRVFNAGHASAGVTAPATDWFMAEGATGVFFDLFLLVANPCDSAAAIEAAYLLPDGTTIAKHYEVPPNSRFTIWVDHEDQLLADTAVATTLRSTNGVPIIAERAMWWPGGTWHEAHNSPGATATGTRWALAEGEVDATRSLETYILVASTSDWPADVLVTLLFEDGSRAERIYERIPARSRFNVPVGVLFPESAGRRFGALVESVGPVPGQIVVERAMYWDAAGQRWAAGTNALATRLQ